MLKNRYLKQQEIPFIGEKGQDKLRNSKIAVVGAGGLGCPVLYYLAAAGVGYIRIIDSDIVEESNLNRQILYDEKNLGDGKAALAKQRIQQFNSEIEIFAEDIRVDKTNADNIVQAADIVISCVDNIKTRLVLNKACVKHNIKMIDGGVNVLYGYVLSVIPHLTPCYHCLYSNFFDSNLKTNTLGAVVGVIGSMMSIQAIKMVLGIESEHNLIYVDMKTNEFTSLKMERNPQCKICSRQ